MGTAFFICIYFFITSYITTCNGELEFRRPLAQGGDGYPRYRFSQPSAVHTKTGREGFGQDNNLRYSTKRFELPYGVGGDFLVYLPKQYLFVIELHA